MQKIEKLCGTIFLKRGRLPRWRHFVVVVEVNAGRHEKIE